MQVITVTVHGPESSRHTPCAVRRSEGGCGPASHGTRSVPATFDCQPVNAYAIARTVVLLSCMIVGAGVAADRPPLQPAADSAEMHAGWQKYEGNPVLGGQYGTCFDICVLKEGRHVPHVGLVAAQGQHRAGGKQRRHPLDQAADCARPAKRNRLGRRHQSSRGRQARRWLSPLVHGAGEGTIFDRLCHKP